MVQELIYPSKELPDHLKCQILSFLRIEWPEGFTGENRFRDWVSSDENHSVSFMLVEHDILISHTEVVWKYLNHAGETYKAFGLTGVFTYPAFRGQGYGKQIVERGTAYIEASDADLGIFHCDSSLKEFYGAFGWIPIESAITLVGPRSNYQVSDELMLMRFLTEKGKRGQPAFENIPLYFGKYTW
jgi:GNAT superfamily N-acetyltransferase